MGIFPLPLVCKCRYVSRAGIGFNLDDFGNIELFQNSDFQASRTSICPHEERYVFKKDTPLKRYFETKCNGVKIDIEGKYTINYIVVVFLANWVELGRCDNHFVWPTKRMRKALKIKSIPFSLSWLRGLVLFQLEAELEQLCFTQLCQKYSILGNYRFPLWCVPAETVNLYRNSDLGNILLFYNSNSCWNGGSASICLFI